MGMLTKKNVTDAIMAWPSLYETENGRRFFGETVSGTPARLRDKWWRNVSSLDESDFKKMGLEVVTARYVGGAHPKRFCRVIVAGETPAEGEVR